MIDKILFQMGYTETPLAINQFHSEEDGSAYQVWKIDFPEKSYVLKQAKGREAEIFQNYFSTPCSFAPELYAATCFEGAMYLLMEYIPGNTLTHCTSEPLIRTMESMIDMQRLYWNAKMPAAALDSRINRGKYLNDPDLETAYSAYLTHCKQMPATLCHDDLLPFNVIDDGHRAVFIDWEVGEILPYPTSIARLIAHSEEREDSLFFMTNKDKERAVDYYFQNFILKQGIDRKSFHRSLDFCLFYEYCEWIYVGNLFDDTDTQRFRSYFSKAKTLAKKLTEEC